MLCSAEAAAAGVALPGHPQAASMANAATAGTDARLLTVAPLLLGCVRARWADALRVPLLLFWCLVPGRLLCRVVAPRRLVGMPQSSVSRRARARPAAL